MSSVRSKEVDLFIRALIIVGAGLLIWNGYITSPYKDSLDVIGVIGGIALFHVGSWLSTTDRFRSSRLVIFLLSPAFIYSVVGLPVGLIRIFVDTENMLTVSTLINIILIPAVVVSFWRTAGNIKREKAGVKISGLVVSGAIIGFALVVLHSINTGFEPKRALAAEKIAGVKHVQEKVLPELWLDELPKGLVTIRRAEYHLWVDMSAFAELDVNSAVDLLEFVKTHRSGRSGLWEWKEEKDALGNVNYVAYIQGSLPFSGNAVHVAKQLDSFDELPFDDYRTYFKLNPRLNRIEYASYGG